MNHSDRAAHWAARLAACADAAEVPGAVLGIWADGDQIVVPHGVLSTTTGVSTTADSIFQIGSITKLWTATMILQLVDEGRIGLDDTVAEVLPGVRLGAADVADRVTVRHLLTHTSGLDGDIFTDTGRGDDCIARYVDGLGSAAQNHPVGAAYSYCNAGFVLLGRMIEVLDGATWDAALRRRLVEPLGLAGTTTLPEDALLHRAAVGHQEQARPVEPVRAWGLMRSTGPAALVTQSAGDLLTFVRAHLGEARERPLLSPARAEEMWTEQARLPVGSTTYDGVGLAWRGYDWAGRRLLGHDGTTLGQQAFLRVDPEARFAVCLLTNSPEGQALPRAILSEVIEEYVGVRMPDPPEPADVSPARPERHVGRYERSAVRLDITEDPPGLHLVATSTGELADLSSDDDVTEYDLHPVDATGDRYVFRRHPGQPWAPLTFDRLSDGTPYAFVVGRTTPRVRAD